ncbi:MAG: hypothetical protein HRT57_11650 [Crocinitomicaceae bacterium]|nr:hypothetical protein [Crocinitomicaceae bacterium]
MHISTDGPTIPLQNMVQQLIESFNPNLILTIGTSGGSISGDNLGSSNITNAGKCSLSGEFSGLNLWYNQQTFTSDWTPKMKYVADAQNHLCQQVPITNAWIEELYTANLKTLVDPCSNKAYSLDQLRNSTIEPGKIPVKLTDYSGQKPVLTTNSYDVATTAGDFKEYAAMEMDNAILGMVCNANKINFGVVRNISDPVQNVDINGAIAGNRGGIASLLLGFTLAIMELWALGQLLQRNKSKVDPALQFHELQSYLFISNVDVDVVHSTF